MYQEVTPAFDDPYPAFCIREQSSFESEDGAFDQVFSLFNDNLPETSCSVEEDFTNTTVDLPENFNEFNTDSGSADFVTSVMSSDQATSGQYHHRDFSTTFTTRPDTHLQWIIGSDSASHSQSPRNTSSPSIGLPSFYPHPPTPKQTLRRGDSSDGSSIDVATSYFQTPEQAQQTADYPSNKSTSPLPATPKKQKGTPGRKRKFQDHELSPAEAARRNIRRERNKIAAAKCRNRRRELTDRLQGETEELEGNQLLLQQEISALQREKERLESLLTSHRPNCKAGLTEEREATLSHFQHSPLDADMSIKASSIRQNSNPVSSHICAAKRRPLFSHCQINRNFSSHVPVGHTPMRRTKEDLLFPGQTCPNSGFIVNKPFTKHSNFISNNSTEKLHFYTNVNPHHLPQSSSSVSSSHFPPRYCSPKTDFVQNQIYSGGTHCDVNAPSMTTYSHNCMNNGGAVYRTQGFEYRNRFASNETRLNSNAVNTSSKTLMAS